MDRKRDGEQKKKSIIIIFMYYIGRFFVDEYSINVHLFFVNWINICKNEEY